MEHEDEVGSTRDEGNSVDEIETPDDIDQALCYQLEYEEEIRREVQAEIRKDMSRKEFKKPIEVIELGTEDEEENINQGIEVDEVLSPEQVNIKIQSTDRNINMLKKIIERNKRKIAEMSLDRNDEEKKNYPEENADDYAQVGTLQLEERRCLALYCKHVGMEV